MSKQFDKSVTEISYLVGIYVLILGAGPLIWNPFAQTLGRRPVVCSGSIRRALLTFRTVYCFHSCGAWWCRLGCLCPIVRIHGWRSSSSRLWAKCCPRTRWRHGCGHFLQRSQRREDWMVDTDGEYRDLFYFDHFTLISTDHTGSLLRTDHRRVHCPGNW